MLPRSNRLTRSADIQQVLRQGTCLGSPQLRVCAQAQPAPVTSRIACVVGKKVSKSAVKRNRLKRQIREAVRLLLKEGRVSSGNMIVLMAKPDMLEATYAEIADDVSSLFSRAKVLK